LARAYAAVAAFRLVHALAGPDPSQFLPASFGLNSSLNATSDRPLIMPSLDMSAEDAISDVSASLGDEETGAALSGAAVTAGAREKRGTALPHTESKDM